MVPYFSVGEHDQAIDVDTFTALYRETLPAVFGMLSRGAGVRVVAEDLTQETFPRAVREIRAGSAETVTAAWLMTVARHLLADHYRRVSREDRKLRLVHSSRRVGDEADPAALPAFDAAELRLVLDGLSSAERAVLVLRHVAGYSVPEVAAMIRRSVSATESLLARARVRLRERLEERTS